MQPLRDACKTNLLAKKFSRKGPAGGEAETPGAVLLRSVVSRMDGPTSNASFKKLKVSDSCSLMLKSLIVC